MNSPPSADNAAADDQDLDDSSSTLMGEGSLPSSSPATGAPAVAGLSVLSSPTKNLIANVSSRKDNPYFDEEVTGEDGSTVYEHFNDITKQQPLTCDIPVSEVNNFISRDVETGDSWSCSFRNLTKKPVSSEKTSGAATGGSTAREPTCEQFRVWMQDTIPEHVALSFVRPRNYSSTQSKSSRGRPRKFPYAIGCMGYCNAKKHGCPTTCAIGFKQEELVKLPAERGDETKEAPTSVSMKLCMQTYGGGCRHKKNYPYGQLRGSKRKQVIEEFNQQKITPAQFTKKAIADASDAAFHSGNGSQIVNVKTMHNVSREAKKKRRKEEGLTGDPLSNMLNLGNRIREEDIANRKDKSDNNLAGIWRSWSYIPPQLEIHLWTRSSVVLYEDLASRGNKLIINVDATGGLVDFPLVNHLSGKMFHTLITVAPKYALLPQCYQKDKTILKNISPVDVAERISNVNTAEAYFNWFREFMGDVIRQSNALTDDERRQLHPFLCLTDCSPQLESGALQGFAPKGSLQLERLHYGNIGLCYLLWFDYARRHKLFSNKKDLALSIVQKMRTHGGVSVFLKECKSHVYRAPVTWLSKQAKKIPKLATYHERFKNILKAAFSTLTEDTNISTVIVSFSVLVAFFQTKSFVVSEDAYFDASSEVQSQRSDTEIDNEQKHLDAISDFIEEESARIQFTSAEHADKVVKEHATIRKQHFNLHKTTGIIERAKKLLQKNCCTLYLHGRSTDGKTEGQLGTVRASYVLGWVLNKTTEQLEMWKEGGFDISVSLPFDGKQGVKNLLHSPEIAHYLINTWLTKPALWSHGIIDLLNDAFDLDIDDNNQLSEATMRRLKEDSGARDHCSEPAVYIRHRWEQAEKSSKLYVQQCGELGGRIQNTENHRRRRQLEAEEEQQKEQGYTDKNSNDDYDEDEDEQQGMTQDQLTQQAEEETTEQWSRNGGRLEQETRLRNTLLSIFRSQSAKYGKESHKAWHRIMMKELKEAGATKVISYGCFHSFLSGKKQSKLLTAHKNLLQSFVKGKIPSPTTEV